MKLSTWMKSMLAVALIAAACSSAVTAKDSGAINTPVKEFRLEQVRLLDSPFKTAMELDRKYLAELDADRMLHMFRVTAGLPSTAQPYGGWEAPNSELRGHSIGHFLSGLSLMYAATDDKAMKSKVDYLVAELAKCQEAMPSKGYNKGYLSAYPESFFDRVDNGQQVWAPWYTYHKIMAGLIDAYTYCGNKQALDVLKKMSAWVKFRTDRLSEEKMQQSLNNEFGGMGESFANLYAITHDPKDLAIAKRFDKKRFTDPLANHQDKLNGLHSNTHIPQVIASARIYELTGDKRMQDIATFFWNQVALHRSFAIGGTSNYEHWRTEPDELASQTTVESQETCCTHNMLKLTRKLFTWSPEPVYTDYYERALYNGILPTIYPENGMCMYYVSLKPGGYKVFGTPTDSFWCCTGTGMENHAKYGDSIYFHNDKSLYVNLFIPSVLNWKEKGVTVRMETKMPLGDTVNIGISAVRPAKFDLNIRVPYWATNGVTVTVNGKVQQVSAEPSSCVTLSRTWKTGDTVSIKMPMSLRIEPMPDDKNYAAVCYGPMVLAAQMGTEKFTKDDQFAGDQRARESSASINAPIFVAAGKDVNEWIEPVPGKEFTWRTKGLGKPNDVTLIPFYQLFDQRYTVYLKLCSPEEYKQVEVKRLAAEKESKDMFARTVDTVKTGDKTSEEQHGFKSELSASGAANDGVWRHAEAGGWFSYDLKVLPDRPNMLRCNYWGGDGGRTFEIIVDGKEIAQESLTGNRGANIISVYYPIPEDLTKGKDKITVRFASKTNTIVGGLYGLGVMKAD